MGRFNKLMIQMLRRERKRFLDKARRCERKFIATCDDSWWFRYMTARDEADKLTERIAELGYSEELGTG